MWFGPQGTTQRALVPQHLRFSPADWAAVTARAAQPAIDRPMGRELAGAWPSRRRWWANLWGSKTRSCPCELALRLQSRSRTRTRSENASCVLNAFIFRTRPEECLGQVPRSQGYPYFRAPQVACAQHLTHDVVRRPGRQTSVHRAQVNDNVAVDELVGDQVGSPNGER